LVDLMENEKLIVMLTQKQSTGASRSQGPVKPSLRRYGPTATQAA
jgi:hypothetical protein